MNKDLAGVLISIGFVFVMIPVSEILRKMGNCGDEFIRKFIHKYRYLSNRARHITLEGLSDR